MYQARGIDFHFFFHQGGEGSLHITVRWGTLPLDAIEVFFEGEAVYDAQHDRFATRNRDYELTWRWIEREKSLFVISFLRRED